ncbi:hypothetical protein B0J12DRAFT_567992 [Macrophomina phaseolina]|uniref:Uncharacterized protein n=1 Tax=Macrophomina phaseolina TaxID=35725 RepID=A0ABQ8GIK4_9PEZI|nr:hypothetical protein B0J12DRAFT_567992 [Macrophomina phaseolina]
MLPQSFLTLATGAALLPLASCLVSPNNTIPEQWKSSLPQVWDNILARAEINTPGMTMKSYENWAMDQVMDGNGTINLCMRWNSNRTLTQTERQQMVAEYEKTYKKWFEWLPGWDNYPFHDIKFKVVGWAVKDRSLLQGSTDGAAIYTNATDEDGQVACDLGCSRDKHLDGDYSGCPGGQEARFHQFLYFNASSLEVDMGAATGYGTYINLWGWENVGRKMGDWPILLHELGHTFGFPDYLDDGLKNHSICSNLWLPPNSPEEFVMKPGDYGAHVPNVTEMEGWMVRYMWSRLSRLRGWQKDNMTYPPLTNCSSFQGDF